MSRLAPRPGRPVCRPAPAALVASLSALALVLPACGGSDDRSPSRTIPGPQNAPERSAFEQGQDARAAAKRDVRASIGEAVIAAAESAKGISSHGIPRVACDFPVGFRFTCTSEMRVFVGGVGCRVATSNFAGRFIEHGGDLDYRWKLRGSDFLPC